jgi:hypothetical protein
VIFRIDNSKRHLVDDEDAAALHVKPGDHDLDILALGLECVKTWTPEVTASRFLPVIELAIQQNPEVSNNL